MVTLTEWGEFRTLDLPRLHDLMLKPAFVFDSRAILPASALAEHGFQAFSIGKGHRLPIQKSEINNHQS